MKVAVLLLQCSDEARVTSHSRAWFQEQFDTAQRYFREQSGGRENLQFRLHDWVKLSLTGVQWSNAGFTVGDTVVPEVAAKLGVSFAGFDHFVLVIDKSINARSGAWNWPGTLRYMHISAQDLCPALLAHELGHLAGAQHGYLHTPFRDVEYGDSSCIMGGEDVKHTYPSHLGRSGPGLTASALRAAGWLDLVQPGVAVQFDLESSGEAEVDITALRGAPEPGVRGAPVVAWADGLKPGHRLLLELRLSSGWDQGFPESQNGWLVAHLTSADGTATSTCLIGEGAAYAGNMIDLPAASVRVTVLAANEGRATLRVTRRMRQVFAGEDGVVYAISETGDLFWYRHDGRGDGSFRWAYDQGRRVGTGWLYEHVFADRGGVIYAIDASGDLYWFRHDGRDDGTWKWAANEGRKVGVGWDVTHAFASDGGVVYAVDRVGDLLWYRHEGRDDGSFRWTDTVGRKVGTGWLGTQAFSGGDGVIYAVDPGGDLLWYRHDGRDDGSFRWADSAGRKVGTGWLGTRPFSGGDGVIYTAASGGDLLWYRHDGRDDGSFRWADNAGRKVGQGWHVTDRSGAGDDVVYRVDDQGLLLWYRHDGHDDGSFRWRYPEGRVVGSGWDARHLFSGDDSVVYLVDAAGALRWYRHDGQVDGSLTWTLAPQLEDGSFQVSGTGWIYEHVFSGDDGVIYAIDSAGDLWWFRHEGRRDGTFRWTDNSGRKVGTGWKVKHAFSGGGGVIYAIDPTGDLLWYRHEGRGDGSFRWADNAGRKVGAGWNVTHAFATGDGVIYTVDSVGDLLWYRHLGRNDGTFRWTDTKGRKVGNGWGSRHVIGG